MTIEDPLVQHATAAGHIARGRHHRSDAAQSRGAAGRRAHCAAASARQAFDGAGDAGRHRGKPDGQARRCTWNIRSCGGRPDTASRISTPCELRFETGGGTRLRREDVPGGRAAVHVQRGWRRAAESGSTAGASFPRGGNWGFSESMLRYRAREYDAAVRYHRDMNFNMIRNWVGQIGEDAFYEACDRHGIVVWQDFWLANPWDGPDPDDNDLFLRNAKDYVLRIRSHPSHRAVLRAQRGLSAEAAGRRHARRCSANCIPGMHYISSSADDVVSGHGPYQAHAD